MSDVKEDKRTRAERVADRIKMLAYRSPKIKTPITWDQQTTAPYTTLVMPTLDYQRGMELAEAVAFFIRHGYPPQDLESAGVFDADGVIVLGWHNSPITNEVAWYGTKTGYDEFGKSPIVDPLMLEIAISQASKSPWG